MKFLKLILVAAALVGIIAILIWWQNREEAIEEPEYSSVTANEIKEQIKSLCKEGKWNTDGYSKIESRIHMDSVNYNIEMQEANSLRMFLYSSSCIYVKDGVDKLFQQNYYPADKITHYETALNHLRVKISEQGANSNLTDASNLMSAYHQLLSALTFGASASYSRPLKAYNGGTADGRKAKIQAMAYYKSHFSKNSSIRSKVERIDADMKNAEERYYESLEKLVENHYKSTGRIEELLEDQIRFDEISTNSASKTRLKNFVNNPNN